MANEIESFLIEKIDPITGHMLGRTSEGKLREFAIAVDRNPATNELTFGVVQHFTDPDSHPSFVESEVWDQSELRREDD